MQNNRNHWEIYQDKVNEWRARFVAGNGEIVMATSEGYINKADCNDAIDVVELEVIERATAGMALAKTRVPRVEVSANGVLPS